MKIKGMLAVAAMETALAAGAFEVENVTARSRFPWNGLIDIDYEITGAKAGEAFAIDVTAVYSNGVTKLFGRTYKSEPIAGGGQNRIVWDMGADCPGVIAPDLQVSVTATPFGDKSTVYCVIDVSGGKDATKYPVRYTTVPPVHTPRDTNDVCKLTEIWLRRIRPAGRDFTIGNFRTPADNNTSYYTRLTKDYYIGVFEITQQQWYQINGDWPSQHSNKLWRATRPMDKFYTRLLYGSAAAWETQSPGNSSLLGKLRTKTGLTTLNLPTEAQWQFACCAGPTKGSEIYRYRAPDGTVYPMDELCRHSGNRGSFQSGMGDLDNGTAAVGMYKPNNFGLYDMLGNVGEDCLDPMVPIEKFKPYFAEHGGFPVVDPKGLSVAEAKELNNGYERVTQRTVGCRVGTDYNTLWYRGSAYENYASDSVPATRGLRLCVTCE